ncbi:MAG: hypothetical protein V1859_05225 [archaeon]
MSLEGIILGTAALGIGTVAAIGLGGVYGAIFGTIPHYAYTAAGTFGMLDGLFSKDYFAELKNYKNTAKYGAAIGAGLNFASGLLPALYASLAMPYLAPFVGLYALAVYTGIGAAAGAIAGGAVSLMYRGANYIAGKVKSLFSGSGSEVNHTPATSAAPA